MKVYMLLDASGSMATSWNDMIGSINSYVRELDNNVEVCLAAFDTDGSYYGEMNYRTIRNTTVKKWTPVNVDDVRPRGGTPLLDAMGRMLWQIVDSQEDRAVFILITDGEENSSKKFQKPEVQKLIDQIKAKDYQVLFFGANFDKVGDVAKNFGLQSSHFINATTRNFGDTMNSTASMTKTYFSDAIPMGYSDDLKKKATS